MKDYVEFLEQISPDKIDACDHLVTTDVIFRDPFNDLKGIADFKKVLHQALDDTAGLKFIVSRHLKDGDTGMLRWQLTGRARIIGDLCIEGMSELRFAEDGRVCLHEDFWDAGDQIFARVPLFGNAIRLMQRRLALS